MINNHTSWTCEPFLPSDQAWFAEVSGDYNPLHLDPRYARRTIFGQQIVHGIHLVLKALDAFTQKSGYLDRYECISVRFLKPLFLGETFSVIPKIVDAHIELECVVEEIVVCTIRLSGKLGPDASVSVRCKSNWKTEPADLVLSQLPSQQGFIALQTDHNKLDQRFSKLIRHYGLARIVSLLGLSQIIGMDCPGRRSLFASFALRFVEPIDNFLHYRVIRITPSISHVRLAVDGAGVAVTLDCFIQRVIDFKAAPAINLSREQLYAGQRILIIGGSRGLGRIASVLLGHGGADLVLTYKSCSDEAHSVVAQIQKDGGRARTIKLDVANLAPLDSLLDSGWLPDQIYYFATPHIFARKKRAFEENLFQEFLSTYVINFANVVVAFRKKTDATVSLFYPSSIVLEQGSKELIEYAMAKAAGESLCNSLRANNTRILVHRLPRLLTEQTAFFMQAREQDPWTIIDQVCRWMQIEVNRPIPTQNRG